jgi:hypothetical protein
MLPTRERNIWMDTKFNKRIVTNERIQYFECFQIIRKTKFGYGLTKFGYGLGKRPRKEFAFTANTIEYLVNNAKKIGIVYQRDHKLFG